MSRIRIASITLTIAIVGAVLAGSGSSGTKLASPRAIAPSYKPKIDPAKFTNHVTNKYFPMKPGMTLHYRGARDGVPTEHTFTVTHQTKTVMGVRCLVISDIVTQNHSLVEKTTDWYAQDAAGSVWYFGEDTAEYQNGVVTNTAGTWEAGVDKAQPGIVMPAVPRVGASYRQEYRPGVALDTARILEVNATIHVPAGTYRRVVVTFDRNPLDPSKKERKFYAPGVGFVHAVLKGGGHSETVSLVK